MDAVLTERFGPGWTLSGGKCRLCGGAGLLLGVAGRAGLGWRFAARVRPSGVRAYRQLLPSVFCSYVPKELYLLQVRL